MNKDKNTLYRLQQVTDKMMELKVCKQCLSDYIDNKHESPITVFVNGTVIEIDKNNSLHTPFVESIMNQINKELSELDIEYKKLSDEFVKNTLSITLPI